MRTDLPISSWLPPLRALARRAGHTIMQVYASGFEVRSKADTSPVTQADELAEAIILEGLAAIAPGIPVIAEESVCAGRVPEIADRFWLVDPLDGTREFVQRNGEFTVNIALVEDGRPVAGVVFAPALGRMYWGAEQLGAGMEDASGERVIRCRAVPAEGLTVLASRSHGDPAALSAYLATWRVAHMRQAGSSLKLGLLAAGEADLYPRFGPTMEWDIAAGHAVLRAAGGHVRGLDGQELHYGKPGFANPDFVASGLPGP